MSFYNPLFTEAFVYLSMTASTLLSFINLMETTNIEDFCSNDFLVNHICANTDDGFTIARNRGVPQSTVIIGGRADVFKALLSASE